MTALIQTRKKTMLKTNSKKYRENFNTLILESVIDEAGNEFPSVGDAITEFIRRFEGEANHDHNKKRIPNLQMRIADYLQGLPFHFPFYNNEILELDKRLREFDYDLPEKKQAQILDSYWEFLSVQLIRRIPAEKLGKLY